MQPNYAIIVAGGSGTRMNSELPKQFLELKGEPILMHTLKAFWRSALFSEIILVLPHAYHDYWNRLCRQKQFDVGHSLVVGGETRFHSVKNGLDALEGKQGLVAVHDGVRPLVSVALLERCIATAQLHGNAVPAVSVHESVRQGTLEQNHSVPRENLWLVQTPQVFRLENLSEYYQQPWDKDFTDDASVAERNGQQIYMVQGERENIKITTPVDLAMAQLLLFDGE